MEYESRWELGQIERLINPTFKRILDDVIDECIEYSIEIDGSIWISEKGELGSPEEPVITFIGPPKPDSKRTISKAGTILNDCYILEVPLRKAILDAVDESNYDGLVEFTAYMETVINELRAKRDSSKPQS
jgi:hypothetical protein